MTETIRSKERVWAVDALRGFAVMAIILLHNIEHFNFYSFPETASPFLSSLDTHLWDMLFFAFAGKSMRFLPYFLALPSICSIIIVR